MFIAGVGAGVGAGFAAGATSFLALKWLKSVHLGLGLVFLVRAILSTIGFSSPKIFHDYAPDYC